MKRIRFFCFLLVLPVILTAQIRLAGSDSLVAGSSEPVETIVDKINKKEPGKGTVRIIQDEAVSEQIGHPGQSLNSFADQPGEDRYIEISGWRVQVFAGNNQRLSKEEAFRKEADIKSRYTNLSTYVTYTAPFWRLRVGDFQTFKDANDQLNRLKDSFPAYGREMSIVKEKILIKEE